MKTKQTKQLDMEIEAILASPASGVAPKWKRALAAYHKELDVLRSGSSTSIDKAKRARDKLYDLVDNDVRIATTSSDPIIGLMIDQIERLPKISSALEDGRLLREQAQHAESTKIRDELREANRPWDWMRKR
jgi:hypothetical protein